MFGSWKNIIHFDSAMAINDTGGNLIVYPNQYENRLSSVHNDDRREKNWALISFKPL